MPWNSYSETRWFQTPPPSQSRLAIIPGALLAMKLIFRDEMVTVPSSQPVQAGHNTCALLAVELIFREEMVTVPSSLPV